MRGFPKNDLTPPIVRHRADWSDLRIFWAVAQAGAFGAAARALRMTTSALTKRVDDLEIRLGATLLVRGPTGVSLTEAGERIIDHVITMEREASAIERLIHDSDRREEGQVTIVVPDGVAGFTLAPRLVDFLEGNPRIRLAIDCDFPSDQPLPARADISLSFDDANIPELVTELVAHIHYCLFASRSYIETYGEPSSLQEAAAHRYVHHVGQHRQREAWRHKLQSFQDLASNSIETNSSTVSLMAAQAGAGCALLPSRAIVRAPELVALDPAPVATLRLWMRYRQGATRAGRVRKVLEWMREVFDAKENPWFRPEFIHPMLFQPEELAPAAEREPIRVAPAAKTRKAG